MRKRFSIFTNIAQMAGNPNWKKGGNSPNPQGRQRMKHSATTIKGKVERFLKNKMNIRQLNKMYDELDARDQFKLLVELLPFVMPKQSAATMDINFDQLTDGDLDALYKRVTESLTINTAGIDAVEFQQLPDFMAKLSDDEVREQLEAVKKRNGITDIIRTETKNSQVINIKQDK